jgi:heme/copper-type cytochrome/quinol oxidase subunit 2
MSDAATPSSNDGLYVLPMLYVVDEDQQHRTFKEMLFAIIIVLSVTGIIWFCITRNNRLQERPVDYYLQVRERWPVL